MSVLFKLFFGNRRNMYTTMRKSFSYELYFCHSKVEAFAVTFALRVEYSVCSVSDLIATLVDFSLFTNSFDGLKGQSGLFKKFGPFNQLLSMSALADNPQVPASAGLSAVGTWCHSSTVVSSRISATRFATNTGCFSSDFNH